MIRLSRRKPMGNGMKRTTVTGQPGERRFDSLGLRGISFGVGGFGAAGCAFLGSVSGKRQWSKAAPGQSGAAQGICRRGRRSAAATAAGRVAVRSIDPMCEPHSLPTNPTVSWRGFCRGACTKRWRGSTGDGSSTTTAITTTNYTISRGSIELGLARR